MTYDTDLLTEAEVAAILHRKPRTVRRLRAAGKLAFLPGKPVLIPHSALDQYLAGAVTIKLPRRPLPRLRASRPHR